MPKPTAVAFALIFLLAGCGDATSTAPPDDTPPSSTASPSTASPSTASPSSASSSSASSATVPAPAARPLWPRDPAAAGVQQFGVEVVRRVEHDPQAWTQGLERAGDHLYESTGRRGLSTLRRVDPATGTVVERRDLEPDLFGEGLTVAHGEIVQLTLQAGRALRHDLITLDPVGEYRYTGEGWGLCHDGERFWMSDGTATLTERDDTTFAVDSRLAVTREDQPVGRLNELECVADADGNATWILANVWYADEVLVIDPATGLVEATIDATSLRAEAAPTDDDHVLNGIATLDDGTLLLGGKNWPTSFVVRLTPG